MMKTMRAMMEMKMMQMKNKNMMGGMSGMQGDGSHARERHWDDGWHGRRHEGNERRHGDETTGVTSTSCTRFKSALCLCKYAITVPEGIKPAIAIMKIDTVSAAPTQSRARSAYPKKLFDFTDR